MVAPSTPTSSVSKNILSSDTNPLLQYVNDKKAEKNMTVSIGTYLCPFRILFSFLRSSLLMAVMLMPVLWATGIGETVPLRTGWVLACD